jgi:RHS repeat-associated protein
VAYTFTDKEKDNTGFIYFGARFYDPEVGRFISVDPAEDGANWYAYCYDNPVRFVDPWGLDVGVPGVISGHGETSGYNVSETVTHHSDGSFTVDYHSTSNNGSQSHSSYSFNSNGNLINGSSSSNDRIANVMGNVLPGSASYGNAINSFQNGDYLGAIGWTANGVAEEFTFLSGIGALGKLGSSLVKKGTESISKIGTELKFDLQFFGKKFNADQSALIDLAKEAQRKGVSQKEANILRQWANELGVTSRGPEVHPNRPYGQNPHIHIGPIDHIWIK